MAVYGVLGSGNITGGDLAAQPSSEEHRLLKRIADGDERAFSQLFDHHYRGLADFVFRLTDSLEMAEEIVQEVFVKVWEDRRALGKIKKISDYLFILCRNRGVSYLRQRARDYLRLQAYAQTELSEAELDSHQWSDREQLYVVIEKAICALPSQQQKIFRLAKLSRVSHAEIAAQLNISAETVKKHMKLALRSVREFVKQHEHIVNSVPFFFLYFLIR